jgi:N-acetylglutamate synthase-like GNAT family acetyltransferase
MSIEIRRLHPSEFDLLKGYADGFCPDAEKSVALVAENESQIIGRIFLVSPVHVEGPNVNTAWRGGTLFKRLVDAVELEARAEGVKDLMAYAVDATMEMYLERLGYTKLPMTVWVKELQCLQQS